MKEIFFVEDDENEIVLYRRAFKFVTEICPTFAQTFEEARTLLTDRACRQQVPAIIVTDLKLNGDSGFDVITWVKNEPALASVPVWVLTSSNLTSDRQKAIQLGAARYLVKDFSPRGLATLFLR